MKAKQITSIAAVALMAGTDGSIYGGTGRIC